MPSKKVFIKRNRPFIHEQIRSQEAVDQLGLTKRGIGSFFINSNSSRKGTGLNDEEIKLLLPQLINVQPTEPDFRKEVERFYIEINTNIPYEKGREFEIGLELDNDLPVTSYTEVEENGVKVKRYNNLPIDLEDYIRFRHAVSHPWTAKSPQDAKGNQTVHFYVEDPTLVLESKITDSEMADRALMHYQTLKEDGVKRKAVLTLLAHHIKRSKPGQPFIVHQLSDGEQVIQLRELAVKKPADFVKVAEDKSLVNKYRLQDLIRVNLLKRAGTSILVAESNEALGAGEEEAVDALFNNPANAQTLAMLKGQYDAKITQEKQLAIR